MNLTADNNVFSEDYVKLRKRTTKRIQTTMLTGRIRQSKGQQWFILFFLVFPFFIIFFEDENNENKSQLRSLRVFILIPLA